MDQKLITILSELIPDNEAHVKQAIANLEAENARLRANESLCCAESCTNIAALEAENERMRELVEYLNVQWDALASEEEITGGARTFLHVLRIIDDVTGFRSLAAGEGE